MLSVEFLKETAAVMEQYYEVDESARLDMASHLSGALALDGSALSPSLDALRQERLAGEYNFNLIKGLVELLPQAEPTEDFLVDDEYSFRYVQANAIETQQQDGNFYIIGSRPLRLDKKAKMQFTELLLWPANKGHVRSGFNYETPDFKNEPVFPQITAVIGDHYKLYCYVSEQIKVRPLAGDELKGAFDTETGQLALGSGRPIDNLSCILSWYSKKPLTFPHNEVERIEQVMMATPKKRWGYEPRTLKGAIETDDMLKYDVLNRLIKLIGEHGKSKEAAAYLLGVAATTENIE